MNKFEETRKNLKKYLDVEKSFNRQIMEYFSAENDYEYGFSANLISGNRTLFIINEKEEILTMTCNLGFRCPEYAKSNLLCELNRMEAAEANPYQGRIYVSENGDVHYVSSQFIDEHALSENAIQHMEYTAALHIAKVLKTISDICAGRDMLAKLTIKDLPESNKEYCAFWENIPVEKPSNPKDLEPLFDYRAEKNSHIFRNIKGKLMDAEGKEFKSNIESSLKNIEICEEKNTFTARNDFDEEVECEILFIVEAEDTGKKYICYTDGSVDNEENTRAYASIYQAEGDLVRLLPIQTEEEWAIINSLLAELGNETGE